MRAKKNGEKSPNKTKYIKHIIIAVFLIGAVIACVSMRDRILPQLNDYKNWILSGFDKSKVGEAMVSEERVPTDEASSVDLKDDTTTEEVDTNLTASDANLLKIEEMEAAFERYFSGDDEIGAAIDVFLNLGDSSFVSDKPVDESFVIWFLSNYGKDSLDEIIREAAGGCDIGVWKRTSGASFNALWLYYCRDTGMHAKDLENVTFKDTASSDKVVLSFTGDMNFDDRMGTMKKLKSKGLSAVLSDDVRQLMEQSDIMMINNECPYTVNGEALEGKAYTFRADPDNISILYELGIDIVGIANNHMCDYGIYGVSDTVDALDEWGMPHVGAGRNLDEAKKPYYFVANGIKIAIVAATQIERSLNYTKEATDTTPGVLKSLNADKFNQVIADADKNADVVIAFIHWGTEGTNSYGSDQEKLAKGFVENGADAIIGGHTHCLQGITYFGDVPCIYSLGNFWFGSTPNDGISYKETGIAQVIINSDESIDFRFVPCVQHNQATYMPEGSEWNDVIDFEKRISVGVDIDSDGYVTKK